MLLWEKKWYSWKIAKRKEGQNITVATIARKESNLNWPIKKENTEQRFHSQSKAWINRWLDS